MLGTIVLLVAVLWGLRSDPIAGVSLQWTAAPLALFVLGRRWALVAIVAGAVLSAPLFGASFGEWLRLTTVAGVVPVLIAAAVLHGFERRAPAHVLVYFAAVYAATFAAASVAHGALVVAAPSNAALDGLRLALTMVLACGETFATAAVATAIALHRPQWLATFDPDRYLPRPAVAARRVTPSSAGARPTGTSARRR